MVLEIAQFSVPAGREREFEAAYGKALEILRVFEGCLSAELRRSVEHPERYRAFINWETIEHHTDRFRGSTAWAELRALVAEFSDRAMLVEHYVEIR